MKEKKNDVDLSEVVHAVKSASDAELKILTDISAKLDHAASGIIATKGNDTKGIEQAIIGGFKRAEKQKEKTLSSRRVNARQTVRKGETNLSFGDVKGEQVVTPSITTPLADTILQEPEQESKNERPIVVNVDIPSSKIEANTPATTERIVMADSGKPVSTGNVIHNAKNHSDSRTVNNLQDSVSTAVSNYSQVDSKSHTESNKQLSTSVQIAGDASTELKQSIDRAVAAYDGYYKDSKGRLHRSDGSFATKAEQQGYESAQQVAKEREQQKQGGDKKELGLFATFATVASSLKDFTTNRFKNTLSQNSTTGDVAGSSIGGAYFYAAKEAYQMGKEAKQSYDQTKKAAKGFKGKLAKTKLGKWLKLKPTDNKSEVNQSVDKSPSESASISNNEVAKQVDSKSQTESIAESDQTNNTNNVDTSTSNKSNTRESSFLKGFTSVWSSLSRSVGSTQSLTKNAKEQSKDRKSLEILKEIDQTRVTEHSEMLRQLEDIDDSIRKSSASGGSSLMDSVGDMFDGRRNRRGRKGRARGRMGSVLSNGAKAAKSGGVSMASKAFGAVSKFGGMAGKAIPFLAPALMAYDAFGGFNDTEKQKEVFDLKEEQEPTAGHKTAMALGSILDMGGLVSGGASLLGSGLEFMGLDGAKEALSFDSGDLAKGIHSFFGGDKENGGGSFLENLFNASPVGMIYNGAKAVINGKDDPKQGKDEGGSIPNANNSQNTVSENNAVSQGTEISQESIKPNQYEQNALDYYDAQVTADSYKRGRKHDQAKEKLHEMDAINSNTVSVDEARAYASKENVSYEQAYSKLTEQKKLKSIEREHVAKSMGIDISGQVETEQYGSLYSPQYKADQVKLVDEEINRRKKVEDIAKDGDFSNGRYIGGQAKEVTESVNNRISDFVQIRDKEKHLKGEQELIDIGMAEPRQPFYLTPPSTKAAEPQVATSSRIESSNEKVSDIKARNDNALLKSESKQTIELGKQTIDAIKQSVTSNNSQSTKVVNTNKNSNQKVVAENKGTGTIPLNFNDRSLQRQAADLE